MFPKYGFIKIYMMLMHENYVKSTSIILLQDQYTCQLAASQSHSYPYKSENQHSRSISVVSIPWQPPACTQDEQRTDGTDYSLVCR